MTHSEDRAHWLKEGAIGLGVGVLYGLTNTCVGHPWDTLKTKMQAQSGFEKTGMFQTFTKTIRSQGVVGLYRGCIPPLWGSGIYRSTQFAVFEGVYTYLNSGFWTNEIPHTMGLQVRVIVAGVVASTSRAIIETPLEFAKIRRQTQQSWELRKVYTGFGVTWFRTIGLMTSYFIMVDTGRRNFPHMFSSPILGPFLISGCAATFAWWLVWPFEYMKSQVQSGYIGLFLISGCAATFAWWLVWPFEYMKSRVQSGYIGKDVPVYKRMAAIIKDKGFFALYRGILPGSIRSFLANGTSMVVMSFAQRKVSQMGLRD